MTIENYLMIKCSQQVGRIFMKFYKLFDILFTIENINVWIKHFCISSIKTKSFYKYKLK
jgi:hypothetical protein